MRGRPRKPPGTHAPRRSGKHATVSGAELVEQRRLMAPNMDPEKPLPVGMPAVIAAVLKFPEKSGAERVRQMWAGKRRYRKM